MERLTWRSSIEGYEDVGLNEGVSVGEAICLLADFEDTGLEPKEIEQLKGEAFGLTVDKKELNEYQNVGSIDHLRELTQAEKDGRLVEVVRCKDCKHLYFKDFSGFCLHRVSACSPDGFCEYGERRKPEEEPT